MTTSPQRRNRIRQAHQLRQQGHTLRQIAQHLNVSHSTIVDDLALRELERATDRIKNQATDYPLEQLAAPDHDRTNPTKPDHHQPHHHRTNPNKPDHHQPHHHRTNPNKPDHHQPHHHRTNPNKPDHHQPLRPDTNPPKSATTCSASSPTSSPTSPPDPPLPVIPAPRRGYLAAHGGDGSGDGGAGALAADV